MPQIPTLEEDLMPRAVIAGSGSELAPIRVTNDQLSRILDTNDEWIRERTGVEARRLAPPGVTTSDLGVAAAGKALSAAGIGADAVDLVVFATMTPDHYFPGCGTLLQDKMGLRAIPCFDIRQQCTGFLYALQLADAHVRAGMAETVLVVAAETHHGFMPWTPENFRYMIGESQTPPTPEEYARTSELRHMVVLFGDAGAAVVVRAAKDGDRGILSQRLYGAGAEYKRLYVPGNGFARQPYVDAGQIERGEHRPVMDGRHVFRLATSHMIEVAQEVLAQNGVTADDVKLVLMHQANLRINEYCQKALHLPSEKVPHNIHEYGNTTAATIPLLWDECVRDGRIAAGDLVLLVAFGAGMTWGATLVRA